MSAEAFFFLLEPPVSCQGCFPHVSIRGNLCAHFVCLGRYGLPVNFQAVLLQPHKKSSTKRLREVLNSVFRHLDQVAAASVLDVGIRSRSGRGSVLRSASPPGNLPDPETECLVLSSFNVLLFSHSKNEFKLYLLSKVPHCVCIWRPAVPTEFTLKPT